MQTKKIIKFPFPIDIETCMPGEVRELETDTNWMKLWKYITLELKQSSIWFIPNFKGEIFAKVLKKRWTKGDLERIKKGDFFFYEFNEWNIKTITSTIFWNLEKIKQDWLIIKCDSYFAEKNREQLQRIAKDLNTRVILIKVSQVNDHSSRCV